MVRFKNRYLVMELLWRDGRVDDSVGDAALLSAFRESLQLNFGDAALGAALASLQVKYANARTGLVVLRCGRAECATVWAALTLTTHVRGRAVMLRLLHQAGTLRACQRAALEHSTAALQRLLPRLGAAGVAAAGAGAADALAAMEP